GVLVSQLFCANFFHSDKLEQQWYALYVCILWGYCMSLKGFWRAVLYWPVRWLTRFETILDDATAQIVGDNNIVYVMRSTSNTDMLVAQRALKRAGLPDPTEDLMVNGQQLARVMYLDQTDHGSAEQAIEDFEKLISAHQKDQQLNV